MHTHEAEIYAADRLQRFGAEARPKHTDATPDRTHEPRRATDGGLRWRLGLAVVRVGQRIAGARLAVADPP